MIRTFIYLMVLLTLFKKKNIYQSPRLRSLVIIIAFLISAMGDACIFLTLLQSLLFVYVLLLKDYSFSDIGLNTRLILKKIKWLFFGLIILIILLLLPNITFIINFGFIATIKHYFGNIKYTNIHLILTTIIDALHEELVFRGILQKIMLTESLGDSIAIVSASAIFTLFHVFNAKSSILMIIFLVSVMLGYIREKSGQIYYTVILHCVWNLLNP